METWWLIDYVDSGGTIRSSTPLPPPTTDVSVSTLTTSEPIRGPPNVSADLPNEEDQRNCKFSTTTNVRGTEEEKKNELATVPTNKTFDLSDWPQLSDCNWRVRFAWNQFTYPTTSYETHIFQEEDNTTC